MLDLSICHPSQSFSKHEAHKQRDSSDVELEGNRFSVLATPKESSTKFLSHPREYPASNNRRTRNSRGTKEAKKRRDMRRNRRKLAAQLLDEQLSQAVDEALTKASFPPPPPPPQTASQLPALSSPNNALATDMVPFPQSTYFASKAPQIPMPHFSPFDLSMLPEISTSDSASPLFRAPTPFRALPKWCPKISSLTLGDVWRDCLPTFYDLSPLPEPAPERDASERIAEEEKQCRDLQMWRPIGGGFGRDRSRFFPPKSMSTADEQVPKTSDRAKVKLPPPVGCRLHVSDRGIDKSEDIPAVSTQARDSIERPVNVETPRSLEKERKSQMPATTISDSNVNDFDESEAANLWRILVSKQPSNESNTGLDLLAVSDNCATEDAFRNSFDQPLPGFLPDQPIAELEGREIVLPYVHANSLTGYSNHEETSALAPLYNDQHSLQDSGISMPILRLSEECNLGLNEMVIYHDVFGPAVSQIAFGIPLPTSRPPTPPAVPPLQPIDNILDILPLECIAEDEHVTSDAHFRSEQALFSQQPPSHAPGTETMGNVPEHSSINVADFLKLGHAKHCWCGHCEDKSHDAATGREEWSILSSITLRELNIEIDEDDNDSTLSLIFNPSESEPDTDGELPELVDLEEILKDASGSEDGTTALIEEDDWLYFSPLVRHAAAANNGSSPSQPAYLPSSPCLHRQRQQRASTPTIIITTSSDTSSDHRSDEYVTVSASHVATPRSGSSCSPWRNTLPRRTSSAWETDLAAFRDGMLESGLAKPSEGSWRWGREDDEEWWDWAVEEEC